MYYVNVSDARAPSCHPLPLCPLPRRPLTHHPHPTRFSPSSTTSPRSVQPKGRKLHSTADVQKFLDGHPQQWQVWPCVALTTLTAPQCSHHTSRSPYPLPDFFPIRFGVLAFELLCSSRAPPPSLISHARSGVLCCAQQLEGDGMRHGATLEAELANDDGSIEWIRGTVTVSPIPPRLVVRNFLSLTVGSHSDVSSNPHVERRNSTRRELRLTCTLQSIT